VFNKSIFRNFLIVEIRKIKKDEYLECEKILRSLPEWFGIESAIVSYTEDIKNMDTYISIENNDISGFITINIHNKYSAEIQVLAIYRDYHKKGIGSKLIEHTESVLKNKDIEYLQVKTLSDSHPDDNYRLTRNFYLKNNFRPLEELKDLWGKDNPCLIMIKKI
jgi:ribosomal protein S18 acetylase RimI-like enzyme